MFNWLKGFDWKKSHPHLELLSKFLTGSSPSWYLNDARWEPVLREKPEQAIKRFVDNGALVRGDLSQHVNHVFKTPDLKAMLKERGIKVSGTRAEQVARLVEHDPEGMKQATRDAVVYACSETGAKLVRDYLAYQEKTLADAEQDVRARLTRKDFDGASRAVARFEATKVFPRGLGTDWQKYDTKPDVFALSVIFGEIPEILSAMQPTDIEPLRLAAAFMYLWGTNRAEGLLFGLATGIALDAETAARMFIFLAEHRKNIEEYKSSGVVKRVRILGVHNSSIPACPACQALDGKTYSLNKVPVLPFKNCTCSVGCRCTTLAETEYGL